MMIHVVLLLITLFVRPTYRSTDRPIDRPTLRVGPPEPPLPRTSKGGDAAAAAAAATTRMMLGFVYGDFRSGMFLWEVGRGARGTNGRPVHARSAPCVSRAWCC